MTDTFGTAKGGLCDEAISEALCNLVDMRPAAIIDRFDHRRPIYGDTAAYGHMGREDLGTPWEKCDIADELRKLI